MRDDKGRLKGVQIGIGWPMIAVSLVVMCACALQAQTVAANSEQPRISVRISTEHKRFHRGEDVRLRVEIWNEGDQAVFVSREIESLNSTALAKIDLTLYHGGQADRPAMVIAADCFCSERTDHPPLASELSRYWIALSPGHFYGGEVVMTSDFFPILKVPGRYRIQGKYISRGFLANSINNPLLQYAPELKQLPFEAWVGEKETNSVWIEITSKP